MMPFSSARTATNHSEAIKEEIGSGARLATFFPRSEDTDKPTQISPRKCVYQNPKIFSPSIYLLAYTRTNMCSEAYRLIGVLNTFFQSVQ